jgi:hypothetical protein
MQGGAKEEGEEDCCGWWNHTCLVFVCLFVYLFNKGVSVIVFLGIIHRPVSETGFCLRLRVEPTQLGLIDRASPYPLCVLNKNKTMDNVQKHNNCISILSSQTFGTMCQLNISSFDV